MRLPKRINRIFLLLALVVGTALHGQIKIGDNPQNIDAASVLELESGSRVLVITRVTDAQMNGITPLRGAMVYNTDTQCVHFYDGVQWLNLCTVSNISLVDNGDNTYTFTDSDGATTDIINTTNASLAIVNDSLVLTDSDNNTVRTALDDINTQTFSTNAVLNAIETISIEQTGNNFNFEVSQITGENIVNGTVNGTLDIQPGSITSTQLQDDAVGPGKIADNVVGSPEIINSSIQPIDMAPGGFSQVLRTNAAGTGVEWGTLDFSSITGQDLTGSDGSIDVLNGAGATLINVDINVAPDGITNDKVADNAINTENITDGQVQTADIADDAVTVAKIGTAGAADADRLLITDAAGDPFWADPALLVDDVTIELDPGNGFQVKDDGITEPKIADDAVTAAKINVDVAGTGLIQNAAGALEVDPTTITGDGDITSTDITVTGGTGATFNDVTLTIANDAVTTVKILDGNVTNAKLDKANIPLSGFGAATANISMGNFQINDLLNPTLNQDAATKIYVDNAVSGVGGSIVSADAGNSIIASLNDGGAFYDDPDDDPLNENQTVSAGTGITVNQVAQDFEVVNAAPDQIVSLADGGSGNVTIGGTYPNLTVDVPSLNDADSDPLNENQTVSAGTGITVNQVAQDFEVVNTAPDQIVSLADGGSGNVTIGGTYPNLTVDVPSLNDADSDPLNENQTVSAGTGITVNQVAQDFEVVNAAPDQIVSLADGGSGNVTIGGTYPNLTVDVPSLNDADANASNEIQTLTSADNSISLTPTGNDYDLSVTNQVVAMGKANGSTTLRETGGTVSGAVAGVYTVTLDAPRANANYIVQLSVQGDNRIYLTTQAAGSFSVEIRDNATDTLVAAVWHYTVLDF
ncbi:beta strand repeat-containing protein [Spongiimicrobium sp. 2-473A-2-J]|uniref:beta strand repeat-containing protein n=2 Tax=Eudoraea algarum TaxID=3417568 RepID=UPI003D36AAD1